MGVRVTKRKVIVEACEDGFMAMDEKGEVFVFALAAQVVRWVKKVDARTNEGVTVTEIEWRDMPVGFVPPEVDR